MNVSNDDLKKEIIKWVDTQITFNSYNISQTETNNFFESCYKKYFPNNSYIVVHSTINPDDCYFLWTVYLCTSKNRYTQFQNTILSSVSFDVIWADFILYDMNHIIKINISANTVNNIVVTIE